MDLEVQEEITTICTNKIYNVFKRLFDIVISLISLLLLIPFFIIIKLLFIITKDYKTIFYTKYRVGKNNKIFKIYKIRTMVYNSDELLKDLLKKKKYRNEWKKQRRIKNDPREHKIGKI